MLKYSGPFPYIRIGGGFTYPLIAAVPDKTEDGDTYFGSFYDKYDAEKFIELLNFIWRTPLCGRAGVKPCLNYHLGKCLAPCGGHINPDEYHAIINEIITCMNGTDKKTRRRLQTEMKAASDILDFERASYLRDCIIALNKLERRRRSLFTDMKGQNVYLFLRAYNEPRFSLFYISDGITVNRADFNNLTGPHEDRIIAFVAENGGLNAADNRDNWDNAYIDDNADSIASGAELTACLLSIGADKYFVPVGEGGDTGKAVKKVIVGFNKWKTSGDDKLVLL
jgi:excinuclease ABC subunit C